ncbi:putative outer membrane Lom domain protein [Escherichia coli DEC5D]|nr:putative outer membrane Lom domain protein [Escherichia coli DEC5D]
MTPFYAEKREVIMRKLYAAILYRSPFVWPYPVRLHGRLNISPR